MSEALITQSYSATTEDIKITARPVYLEEQSDLMARKFVFAYFIRIENHGKEPVQLLRRHWFINHAGGRIEEVEGEGVVGKQPVIEPGSFHDYNSFCVLDTFEGTMEGTYLFQRAKGEYFRATIPRFTLRAAAN
jgi:ApaG protein